MAAPTVELQVAGINFDKANQNALATLQLLEEGLVADDLKLYDLRKTEHELALTCGQAAIKAASRDITIEYPRAWVPIARNVFRYLRLHYRQARVHESMLILSDRHEFARANQALVYMNAVEAEINQPATDAYLSLLWPNGKWLD